MEESITTRDILSSFFRQYKMFRLIFLASIAISILSIIFSTTLYQASGSLLVKFGSDADAKVNDSKSDTQLSSTDRREVIQSNVDIIRSHDLLKMVVEKIGVEQIYPGLTERVGKKDSPLEMAIQNLKNSHLTVKSSTQSNIIDINAMNTKPEMAAEIVEVIQNVFITRQLEIFNKPQIVFLQEQIKIAGENLNKSQQVLREFKNSVGISSIEEELNELLKQKSSAATVAFQSVDDAQAKLSELHDKEATMLSTYRSNSPALKGLRKEIAEAERQLKERQSNISTTSKTGILSEQNAGINKRISELEEQRGHYNDLLRQVLVNEENYKKYVEKSEEARINATLGEKQITSISVVDTPTVSVKPARPRKSLSLIIGIMAGIVLGCVAVFAREVFDERFRTPRQLAKALRCPVLADFPKKDGMMRLFNGIDHLLNGVRQPIIQIVSSYDNENIDRLVRELATFANIQGKKILLLNTRDTQKNLQKLHSEFTSANPDSWTIITNAGFLRDELGQSLSKFANGTILVVEAENTRAPVAQEVRRLINALGGKIIGAVLVNRKFYIPSWLYRRLYKADN